jgi:hypothetical protein
MNDKTQRDTTKVALIADVSPGAILWPVDSLGLPLARLGVFSRYRPVANIGTKLRPIK